VALAFVGNSFLIHEAARIHLRGAGFQPRDVPWLEEEVTPDLVAANAQGGLFGPAALVVDVTGLKEYKPILEELGRAPDAVAVLLDAENWSSTEAGSEVMRKRKAQESRVKAYEKAGLEVVTHPTPQKGALIAWVTSRAKALKLPLEKDVPKLLADTFPDDVASIASELEKLAVLEVKLDAATVQSVVNANPPTTMFAVTDALVARKPVDAWAHLERLLNMGEDPFKLLGALQGHYQLIARAYALRARDEMIRPAEAAKLLSVHEFRAQKALEAVRRYTEKRVRFELETLLQADIGMKSGLEPKLTLERLVLELGV
jgi:DNA polymerase III subunit delta